MMQQDYVPLDEAAVQCSMSREAMALRVLEDGARHHLVEGRVVVESEMVDRYRPWWWTVLQDPQGWIKVCTEVIWPALVDSASAELGLSEENIFNGRRDVESVERRDLVLDAARRMGFSYAQIARITATDRSTIWHAMKRIEHLRLSQADDRTVLSIMMGCRVRLEKKGRML